VKARIADPRRQRAERAGRRGEAVALWYLRLKLYRLLARRYRTPVGEIDLIMRRGPTIVFVEVKQRPDEAAGIEAVTARARARIARAAAHWIAAHPAAAHLEQRFDIVVAMPGRRPRHLVSAFGEGGAAW
jgi:putative endonuclease